MRKEDNRKKGGNEKIKMLEKVATNIVASRPLKRRPTWTQTTRANYLNPRKNVLLAWDLYSVTEGTLCVDDL